MIFEDSIFGSSNKVSKDCASIIKENNIPLTQNKHIVDIYYIVRLKEKYRQELCLTTITKDFCGKIVNQTAGNIYFELNGSDALVIVPHNWIEWLAPSKKLWEMRGGK